MCPDVVNGEDVWMVECRRGTCFLLEAIQSLRISGEGGR
jgi:hypothetical protein